MASQRKRRNRVKRRRITNLSNKRGSFAAWKRSLEFFPQEDELHSPLRRFGNFLCTQLWVVAFIVLGLLAMASGYMAVALQN